MANEPKETKLLDLDKKGRDQRVTKVVTEHHETEPDSSQSRPGDYSQSKPPSEKDRGSINRMKTELTDVGRGVVNKTNNPESARKALKKVTEGKDSPDQYTRKDMELINTVTHNNGAVLQYLMKGGSADDLVIVQPKGRYVGRQGQYDVMSPKADPIDETRFSSHRVEEERKTNPDQFHSTHIKTKGTNAYYSSLSKDIDSGSLPKDKPWGDPNNHLEGKQTVLTADVYSGARKVQGNRKAHELKVYTPKQYEEMKEKEKQEQQKKKKESPKKKNESPKELKASKTQKESTPAKKKRLSMGFDTSKLTTEQKLEYQLARSEEAQGATGNTKLEKFYNKYAAKMDVYNPYSKEKPKKPIINKEDSVRLRGSVKEKEKGNGRRRLQEEQSNSPIADYFDEKIAKEEASLKKDTKQGQLRGTKQTYDQLPDKDYSPESNSPPALGPANPSTKSALSAFAVGALAASDTAKLPSSAKQAPEQIQPSSGKGRYTTFAASIKGTRENQPGSDGPARK